jgi:hypothetical protein
MSTALKKSPLARVNDEFGGKDKLVDKIVGVLGSGLGAENESKDDVRKRLLGVANRKLIRLYSVATRTKEAGGHDKLAQSAADGLHRGKDKDYVTKLGEYSNGRLLDMLVSAEGRKAAAAAPAGSEKVAKRAAAKAKAAAKPKAEKAVAKPARGATKKTAAKKKR